jgi:hypothetical protein
MAQHHGIDTAGIADTAVGEIMQIGAANADSFHCYLNLAGLRI